MRRIRQKLSREECVRILENGTSGVLAVSGDEDYPYAVPLSYAYRDSAIIFHCAGTGHKLDGIARNSKASFCVIDRDTVVPEEYTTYFQSVIVFGKVRILEDGAEKRSALETLAAKYSPDLAKGRGQEVDRQLGHVCVLELAIEHMSGKESIELVRGRNA